MRKKLLSLLPALGLALAGCGGGGSGGGQSVTPVQVPLGRLLSKDGRPGPMTIMPLGDSITYGYGDPAGNGYRLPLWQTLTAAGCSIQYEGSQNEGSWPLTDTRNEGHRAYRIDMIAGGVDDWLKNTQPEIILLVVGTNDIKQGYQLSSAPARLSALMDQIVKDDPQGHLLVASIPPIFQPDGSLNADVQAYNAAIPGLVQAKEFVGEPVSYVDMQDVLTASDLSADAVHPNPQGYAKMAKAWFQALQQL